MDVKVPGFEFCWSVYGLSRLMAPPMQNNDAFKGCHNNNTYPPCILCNEPQSEQNRTAIKRVQTHFPLFPAIFNKSKI